MPKPDQAYIKADEDKECPSSMSEKVVMILINP